jgi:hypothetical protein
MLQYTEFMKTYLLNCHGTVSSNDGTLSDDSNGSVTNGGSPYLSAPMLRRIQVNLDTIATCCSCAYEANNSINVSVSIQHDNNKTGPVVYLNVSGEKMSVLRASILRCAPLQDSQLAVRVSGRWNEQDVDEEGYIRYVSETILSDIRICNIYRICTVQYVCPNIQYVMCVCIHLSVESA